MRGHGKGKFHEHTAGVALDGGVNKIAALGKFDDLRQFCIDFGAGHAENRAVHIDVLAACHFVVEAGADLQHRRHAAADFDFTLGGGGDAGEQL